MNAPAPLDLGRDVNVIKLAREIAIDHYPENEILARYQIDDETWAALNEWPRFQELIAHEKQQWHGALNTAARVRLKSATLIEEWMAEGDRYLHDREQSLSSKIELLKLLGKFSQLDAPVASEAGMTSGRVTININMGDNNIEYQGNPETIEVDYSEKDPNVIDFDWEEEFPVIPVEGSEAIFSE